MTDALLSISVFGPLRVRDFTGQEIWISSKKGQALLAALVVAPGGERTRAWLCDHLWGSRQTEQARASLRREISSLRALSMSIRHVLFTRGDRVGIDLTRCYVDALTAQNDLTKAIPDTASVGPAPGQFLEGIDIAGEERFEDWLRHTRQSFEAAAPVAANTSISAGGNSVADVEPSEPTTVSRLLGAATRTRLCVGIAPPECSQADEMDPIFWLTQEILDAIAGELRNRGGFDIFDYRSETAGLTPSASPGPDAILRLRSRRDGDALLLSLRLNSVGNSRLIWSRQLRISVDDEQGLIILINEAVECIMFEMSSQVETSEGKHVAACHAAAAIHQVFGLQPGSIDVADRKFRAAQDICPEAVYLAWLAYISSFKVDFVESDSQGKDVREEADMLSRKALELDPFNTQVLGLLIHVHSFVLRDFEKAHVLVDQAEALGARNLIFFDSSALLYIYSNQPEKALRPARIAATIGRFLPYRYCFETTLCMIETLRGEFSAAKVHGRTALALAPSRGAPPFAPIFRFLLSAHVHLNEPEEAERCLQTLRLKEPDLGSNKLDEPNYPLPSANAVALLKKSLRELAA